MITIVSQTPPVTFDAIPEGSYFLIPKSNNEGYLYRKGKFEVKGEKHTAIEICTESEIEDYVLHFVTIPAKEHVTPVIVVPQKLTIQVSVPHKSSAK